MSSASVHNETPQKAPKLDFQALFGAIELELKREVKPITVVYISEKKSRDINAAYRQKECPTNILSFGELREIYICPSIVLQEAEEGGIDYNDWMTCIMVHGILHLEGFSHESKTDADEMEAREQRVLKILDISLL